LLETWDIDWELVNTLSMTIDYILQEKVFIVDENDMDALMEGVKPLMNEAVIMIEAPIVEFVGCVLYSLHVCVCGCVRYDNCGFFYF
jgi:hypothetical protein